MTLARKISRRFENASLRLPIVPDPNDLARFSNAREQLTNSVFLARQNQVWPNIGQRLKNEFSLVHPRVRQVQSLGIEQLIAGVEQIDVDGSRNVFLMFPPPAQCFFDPNQLLK
jgi:hypothetical protein